MKSTLNKSSIRNIYGRLKFVLTFVFKSKLRVIVMQGKNRVLTLILLISLSAIIGCADEPAEQVETIRPVRAIKVGDAKQLKGREFPGRAKAVREVNLAFDVSGTLNKRPVKVGENIVKGQLIAGLDSRDFRSNVSEAKANMQNAYANFNRAKELIKKNFISKAEYDKLNAQARVTAAERDKAVKALADTEIKAPFSGYISELYVENFQAIQAKQQIARLVDLSQIEMIIDIPESIISLVPYAEGIMVVFDAFPDHKILANVKEIGTEASTTTRTFPVTLIMDQPNDIKILPGMAGKATGKAADNAPHKKVQSKGIQVPVSAVYSPANDNKSYVWVINEASGLVRRQAVSLGKIVSTGLVITDGLKPGEWVATAGVNFIREGMKVRILQDKEQ